MAGLVIHSQFKIRAGRAPWQSGVRPTTRIQGEVMRDLDHLLLSRYAQVMVATAGMQLHIVGGPAVSEVLPAAVRNDSQNAII